MAGFFGIIFLLALVALPISLIKPQIFSRFFSATRTKNSLILGAILFVSLIMIGITAPEPVENATEIPETKTQEATTKEVEVEPTTPLKEITQAPTNTPTPTKKPSPTPTKKPAPTKAPTAVPTRVILPTATTAPATSVPVQSQPSDRGYPCNCSKTCTQISSCAEAQYLLNVCGCGARDGDKDGIACDSAPLNCQN